MDQIREQLDRISELSSEELSSLKDSIVTEFKTVKTQDLNEDVVSTLAELADANDLIKSELSTREAQAAELSAAAEEAISRIESEGATAEGEQIAEAEAAVEEAPEAEAVEEVVEEEAPAEEVEEAAAEEEAEVPAEEEAEEAETEDEEEDEEDKKSAEFASEEATTSIEADATAELAVEEAPVEEEASETETVEETNTEADEDSAEDIEQESSEEPVTASSTPENFEAPASHRVAVKSISAPVTITAGADLPGISAGQELSGLRAVAQALLDRKKGMGRTSGGDGEQHTVATFTTAFPEDRYLTQNDFDGNRAKLENVVSADAIVAAGGLTAPVETSYEIFGLSETLERPIKNSLAVFGADRGGIRFLTPPTLPDLNGAVSLWTLQDDIDAVSNVAKVKPCIRVAAGEEVTVYVDAIPLCLTFGNLAARAYPELVERHTKLAMVQHARYSEVRLITRIGALSTQVTAAKQLGAARDIFVQIEQAAAAYRSRYRIDPKAPLRVMFPEWFKNALRADLTKQLPGDGRDGTFNLVDGEISKWFSVRNINVTWFLDGETGQIFGEQADGALMSFPNKVIWYLFSEGTFLFLDGGTLDLGLVRDSTLNGTNDYKIFLETFEGVAKVGIESLRIESELAIAGASAGTVDTLV